MNQRNLGYPLIKHPITIELTLLLIKEELKSHKFFNGLRTLGLDDCYYQSDLSTPILTYIGLGDETNETFDLYFALLEKYSNKIEANDISVSEHALNVYTELVAEKQKRDSIPHTLCDQNLDT